MIDVDNYFKRAFPQSYNAEICHKIQNRIGKAPTLINDKKYRDELDKYNMKTEDLNKKTQKEKIILIHDAISFLAENNEDDKNLQEINDYMNSINHLIKQIRNNEDEKIIQQSIEILQPTIKTIINKYQKILEDTNPTLEDEDFEE